MEEGIIGGSRAVGSGSVGGALCAAGWQGTGFCYIPLPGSSDRIAPVGAVWPSRVSLQLE